MQPEATHFHGGGDLAAVAPAYAFHTDQNQRFLDGSKRAAMGPALALLKINGINVEGFDGAKLDDAMIPLADKRLDKAGLAALFRTQLSSA